MGFEFRDSTGRACGSTEFAKSLLADQLESIDAELAASIRAETKWRENYQHYFYELTRLEVIRPDVNWAKFSDAVPARIANEAGETMAALAARGFANRHELKFVRVVGTGQRMPIAMPAVASSLSVQNATADALHALDFVRANSSLDISGDILVALAGYAELSAAKAWLDWGGTVAVIARKNDVAHAELVAHAQRSAGTLLFVEGGIDLIAEIEKAGHFLRTLSREGKRLVVASFGYAPGANQIKLQAAQLALTQLAQQLPKSQVALAWLATPLDVIITDAHSVEAQIAAYRSRGFATKLRDAFWQLFGSLKPATPEVIEGEVGIFDASANRQGSSYILAKHSERWAALAAARAGVRISFVVAPPAETRSVLGAKKVLARTYRGLARFGVRPLEAEQTATLMAAILVRSLHDPAAPQNTSATAIHAGLWSMPYQVDSVWVPASLIG